jgi:hypothetical protein
MDGRGGEKKRNMEPFFYQWQWRVIYPNSTKFGSGGVPLELLHENHGVGASSTVFRSGSGAAGADFVWLTSFGAELVFDLELRGALPNTAGLVLLNSPKGL